MNEKKSGAPTLTASPPEVYVLEPNVLTAAERDYLNGSGHGSPFADVQGSPFAQAVNALYDFCRNPNGLSHNGGALPDQSYPIGIEQEIKRNSMGQAFLQTNSCIVTPV